MDDFVRRQGPAFLAHMLRRVSDEIVGGATAWYPETGTTAPPRTASTLLLLDGEGPRSISDIAGELRQSHQLVITWVRQLAASGYVETRRDAQDGRKTLVSLTAEGQAETARMRRALNTMAEAMRRLSSETGVDFISALWALDEACSRKSVEERLREID